MLRLSAKNVWARKLRTLMTTFAVFLGIAFVAGTYVLTDTINTAFDRIFDEAFGDTQVVVTAEQAVTQDTGEAPSVPAGVLGTVEGVEGVTKAAGEIFSFGITFTAEGERVGTPFAPQFVASVLPPDFDEVTYAEGRAPQTADEAALDEAAAEGAGIEIGDEILIAAARAAKSYEVVGLLELGEVSFGGTSVSMLVPEEAERVTDRTNRFDAVYAIGSGGIGDEELRDRVAAEVGEELRVETVDEHAERQSSEIKDELAFLRVALLIFAGIALFVGAFMIFNTFSITVAQRVREFGLMRTLGASRRQILGTVVLEAGLIGLLGALLGILGGVVVAELLTAMFRAIGAELPSVGNVILPRTVLISLALGIGVTMLSALTPALRSTRVSPMAAILAAETGGDSARRRHWAYSAAAGMLAAAGLSALLFGLLGDPGGTAAVASLMGGGAVSIVIAVSLFSSYLVRPLTRAIGAPLERLGGVPGRLARENGQRNPGRTAVTAAALMIGIAVVTVFASFGAGLKLTISEAIEESLEGELVLTTDGFATISPEAAEVASDVEGVEAAAAMRYSNAEVEGVGREAFTGLNPDRVLSVLSLDWVEGTDSTFAELSGDETILTEGFASGAEIAVGERISVTTQTGEQVELEAVGIIADDVGLYGSAIVTQDLITETFGSSRDMIVFISLDDGFEAGEVQERLTAEMEEPFPTVEVLDQSELQEQQEATIDGLLTLVYALVGLAIVVSLFGIANTLALSIHERVRELGTLRAVGMSRRQVRRMIRYEAVITASMGALLGLALGLALAALISIPLADEGLRTAYPVETLAVIMVLAALAGVLSAILPARRASRLDVLEAIGHE